ncbi:MAG: TonB family protein [Pseudomonadota bacterium]
MARLRSGQAVSSDQTLPHARAVSVESADRAGHLAGLAAGKGAGLTNAIGVSLFLHLGILLAVVWDNEVEAFEPNVVEAIPVELVLQLPEQSPNFSENEVQRMLTDSASSTAEEAAAEISEKPASAAAQQTETADETEQADAQQQATAESAATAAEQAQEAAATQEARSPSSAEADEETASEPQKPTESDAAHAQGAMANGILTEQARNAPIAPIFQNLGAPTSLYGGNPSGEPSAAPDANVDEDATENVTGPPPESGEERNEEETASQVTDETAREEPVDATPNSEEQSEEAEQEASEPRETETEEAEVKDADAVAREASGVQSPERQSDSADRSGDPATQSEDVSEVPTEIAALSQEAVERSATTAPNSLLEETSPTEAPKEEQTPTEEIPRPIPNPNRHAENEPTEEEAEATEEAIEDTTPTLQEALQAALAMDAFSDGGMALGRGEAAQVAYTEAVRSAVAPGFFRAMNGVNASGMALVDVVIRRGGTVQSAKLVESSGVPGLDNAALAAAQTAPYPRLPPDVEGETLLVRIPFRAR